MTVETDLQNAVTALNNAHTSFQNALTTVNAGVADVTTKANNAATSATNAANSATMANTKAGEANTSATNASASATTATTKASEASASATNAANSATAASGSAGAAASSATAANDAAVAAGAPVLQTLTDGPAITFDVSAGKYASVTLGGNRSLYFSKIKAGEEYKLIVFQDATGGRTLSFSSRVKWVNDVAPTISSGANTMTVLRFISNGVMLYGVVDQIYDGYAPSVAIDFRDPNIYNDMPSWLDYSGTTGNRMYVDHTGKLTWAPNNILLNSATLATQTVAVTSGSTKILSFTGTGSIALSGAATGTLAGTGANNRVSLVITPSTSSLTLTVSGDVRMAQLERVTYQTTPRAWIPTTTAAVYQPRYDYDPSTVPATPRGLLVEGTRTNTLINSNGFSTASWTTGSASLSGTTTGPDGVSTSGQGLLAAAATTAEHSIYQPQSGLTANANYALSLYVKADTTSYVYLMFGNGSGYWATAIFDLTTQSTTTASQTAGGATSGTVVLTSKQYVGNGWFRIALVANVNKTNPNCFIGHASAATGNTINAFGVPTFTSVGTERFYMFGAQLEAASFASSYIPTVASTVTRAADVLKASGAAKTILGATTGTAIMQVSVPSIASYVNLLGDASRVLLWADANTTLKSSSQTPSPAVLSATIGGSGTWTGGAVRAAVSWGASGRSIVANNGTVASDSNTFGTATDVPIFSVGNGTIESMALYSINLPDAIEKSKSTVGAAF